jgi:nucleotide-binding universal stress UspA family protein
MSRLVSRFVVGVDGSPDGDRALDWALFRASRLGAAVHVVHAGTASLAAAEPRSVRDAAAEHEQQVRAQALGRADAMTQVPLTFEQSPLRPAEALIRAAGDATAVVVGARGHGRMTGALLGSVSQHVARHAPCSAVVVREASDVAARTVVVGVDDSPASRPAVDLAFELADAEAAPLLALRAWQDPSLDRSGVVLALKPELDDELHRTELASLDAALAASREKHPGVAVTRDVVPAHPQRLLTDASEHAALVVVGCRGRGGFPGLLLGSVSQSLLQYAACPVAVAR